VKHLEQVNAELLAALKLCVAVCDGDTFTKTDLLIALSRARAAIAKASGK